MKAGEKTKSQLRVTLFPDSAGKSKMWVAQCLDYDLIAQGATPEQAQQSFMRVLRSHVCLALANGETPFECIVTKAKKQARRTSVSASRVLESVRVAFGTMDRVRTVAAV
jgi:hypothetical protein